MPMRQKFDVKGGPETGRQNLPLLREELAAQSIDGLYIPHEDEFQNEYQPEANQRLAWATGFTGSAGAAFVTLDKAWVFVDGRYTVQIRDQVDPQLFEIAEFAPPGPWAFLSDLNLAGKTIGYDPQLITPVAAAGLKAALTDAGATAKALRRNPIDRSWKGRPRQPMTPVVPHDVAFAGQSSAEKREQLAAQLRKRGIDASILTAPHAIAWLFNIRGNDVKCSPLPLARAVLKSTGEADLYIAPRKVDDAIRHYLGNQVAVRDIAELPEGLAELGGKKVLADPGSASEWFFTTLKKAKAEIVEGMDITALPKARKNSAEVHGAQMAHNIDGVAVTRILHWLARKARPGKHSEIDVVRKLEKYRMDTGKLNDISFETIAGFGSNGAMNHYRVNTDSNKTFETGGLFLLDSGGQYYEGTTDVTRTVCIGNPTEDMKRHYTLVLKGHIALSVVRFPKGTSGIQLDVLARHALWQAGLDYDHGTGHGVGAYLGVHEGPQRIAKAASTVPLEPGMIVSNEPGYYIPGQYGIRIENLQYVTEPEVIPGGTRPMMRFETLTLAPLARDLMDKSLLTESEISWVNDYHMRVWNVIGGQMDEFPEARAWLEKATAPL